MSVELQTIAERIAANYSLEIDNWLRPLVGRYLPPEYDLTNFVDPAEIYYLLEQQGIHLEFQYSSDALTQIYRLKQGNNLLGQLTLRTTLKV